MKLKPEMRLWQTLWHNNLTGDAMSYNGSGTFVINTSGQPVVAGTVISSTAFNALTADLATGLSTAITKDGQTATTARIPFAAGINSTLVTDSTSVSTGSIITAGGVGVAKALYVGTTANIAGVLSTTSPNITTSITTPSTSFDLINATATTLNLAGAATAVNVGAATGTMTVANTTLAAKAITASTTLGVTGTSTLTGAVSTASNLTFTGTGNRITGDTNSATISSRLFFQSSTTNGSTTFGALPNGTSLVSGYQAYNNSDPTNAAFIQIATSAGTEARVTSGITGTGTYLPMTFYTGGSERARIDTSGNVGIGTSSPTVKFQVGAYLNAGSAGTAFISGPNIAVTNTAGMLTIGSTDSIAANIGGSIGFTANGTTAGYPTGAIAGRRENATASDYASYLQFSTCIAGGTVAEKMRISSAGDVLVTGTGAGSLGYGIGSGGTVTQGTSRTTGVTLSKPTGAITMFSAAGSVVAATFTVTNTLVAATDTIILNQKSGTNLYVLLVTAVAAGSFNITFYTTGGVATDAPVINFSLIKGVTA